VRRAKKLPALVVIIVQNALSQPAPPSPKTKTAKPATLRAPGAPAPVAALPVAAPAASNQEAYKLWLSPPEPALPICPFTMASGKDGIPYPVDRKTYDQSIELLARAINKAKLGLSDKRDALNRLNRVRLKD